MSALAKIEKFEVQNTNFTASQIELIKNLFCKGLLDEELQLFIQVCQKTGLCPFSKQVYAVKRNDKKLGREVMTIQTSIDGYRLIADRTGCYCPGKEPTFQYDKNGSLMSATSYVKKLTRDGTWHEIAAVAFFNEYAQGFKDFNTGQKKLTSFWADMPHNQLAKCAESLALRKAFPGEFNGIYTKEEMGQADTETIDIKSKSNVKQLYISSITSSQGIELSQLLQGCSPEVQKNFKEYLKTKFNIDMIDDLPENEFVKHKDMLVARYKAYQEELVKKEMENVKLEVEVVE